MWNTLARWFTTTLNQTTCTARYDICIRYTIIIHICMPTNILVYIYGVFDWILSFSTIIPRKIEWRRHGRVPNWSFWDMVAVMVHLGGGGTAVHILSQHHKLSQVNRPFIRPPSQICDPCQTLYKSPHAPSHSWKNNRQKFHCHFLRAMVHSPLEANYTSLKRTLSI